MTKMDGIIRSWCGEGESIRMQVSILVEQTAAILPMRVGVLEKLLSETVAFTSGVKCNSFSVGGKWN